MGFPLGWFAAYLTLGIGGSISAFTVACAALGSALAMGLAWVLDRA